MLWFAVGVRSRGFVPRLSMVSVTSLVVVGGLRAWLRVCYCCVYREVFSVELSGARLGFSPLHADVWSEDSCRRNGPVRLLPAAWRGVKFFLRVPATVSWRAGLRGASSCQGLRVARVSFLVRVFAMRVACCYGTMVFRLRKRQWKEVAS